MPGRDTVAFWDLKEEGIVYEIGRFDTSHGSYFNFRIIDTTGSHNINTTSVKHVHFYADTSKYIFVISEDYDCYCVDKRTGVISQSSVFEVDQSAEQQICFINLFYEE